MKRSSGPRTTPSRLSESIHQQLNMYTLAAGAAGVSFLVFPQPAEAKVVYTRANVSLGGVFNLDLNGDGIVDFQMVNSRTGFDTGSYVGSVADLSIFVAGDGVGAWGVSHVISALPAGVRVGPKDASKFVSGNMAGFVFRTNGTRHRSSSYGKWKNVKSRYLGLEFSIQGKSHFGWARLNVQITNGNITAILTGYAYETTANKPIVTGNIVGDTKEEDEIESHTGRPNPTSLNAPTPQPATLGALAMGARGLSIWRRE